MSDNIPECKWTEFVKIVKDGKIEELKSCEVTFNGIYMFTAIIPHGDIATKEYAKTQGDYLGLRSNIISGKDPSEVLAKELVEVG